MTLGGWITMTISMGAFACLFVWCMFKVAVSDHKLARPQKNRQDKRRQ